MLLFTPSPLLAGRTLENVREDYKSAQKIGRFRVSELALYTPEGYLLRADIADAISGFGSAHVTGCCAGGVPVPRVVVVTSEKKFPLLCDTEANANRLAEALKP